MKYLIIAMLIAFLSCKTPTPTVAVQEINLPAVSGSQILFLQYILENPEAKEPITAKLVGSNLLAGQLKREDAIFNTSPQPGDLILNFMDGQNNVLKSLALPNPLTPVMESPQENGKMAKHQLQLKTAQLPIRTQLPEHTKWIRLLLQSDKQILLLETKLNHNE